jgi:hypothetical protein
VPSEFIMVMCTGHGDLFRTMAGSISAREKLCAACVIRQEKERERKNDKQKP